MAANPRRHTVLLSDKEITLLERAMLAYAQLIRIQTGVEPREESDQTARVASLVQQHRYCGCPAASG